MAGIEEIDQGTVFTFDQPGFQVPHESAGGEPEIISHQDDRLKMLPITMTECGDQLRVLLTPPGKQPLLELVEHEQNLMLGWQECDLFASCQRIDQPQSLRKLRTRLA